MAVIDVRVTSSNGKLAPSIDPVVLSKGKGDTIEWFNDTAQTITIAFDGGCPFGDHQPYNIQPGQHKHSGSLSCNPDSTWNYAISVPTGPVTDPQVIVQR